MTVGVDGLCSYCLRFDRLQSELRASPADKGRDLAAIVEEMGNKGRGREYDCIIGLSGGIDSSYVAYQVVRLGLRPLAVHLDNGWNSELATSNINALVTKLGLDLETYVIDWEEFRDLQRAFLRASVVDIELLTDHAIGAVLHRFASRHRIRYLIQGGNLVTEGVMPGAWAYSKIDSWHIRAIHRRFGTRKLKTFPFLTPAKLAYYNLFLRLSRIKILNYIDYEPVAAKRELHDAIGWRDYGGKHYESTFTKFYQAFLLPRKFRIDKRRAHYSSLICSGKLSRDDAIALLKRPLYDPDELRVDTDYFCKKLGLDRDELERIMGAPARAHQEYPSLKRLVDQFGWIKEFGRRVHSDWRR